VITSRDRMKLARQTLIVLLVVTVFASVLTCAYIHISYGSSMPRTPQPEVGRIYPLRVNHGTLVYVNRQELDRANFVFHPVFLFGMCSVLALAFIKQYWDVDKPGPP
jgi:cell division protein YceG involved in septum cleavage